MLSLLQRCTYGQQVSIRPCGRWTRREHYAYVGHSPWKFLPGRYWGSPGQACQTPKPRAERRGSSRDRPLLRGDGRADETLIGSQSLVGEVAAEFMFAEVEKDGTEDHEEHLSLLRSDGMLTYLPA